MGADVIKFATLKNRSSSGYDGTSNRILEFCGKTVDKPLAYIFYKSLKASKFLDQLNTQLLIHYLKKGRKFELTNYKPIYLPTGVQRFVNYRCIEGLISNYKFTTVLLLKNIVLERDCQ
jgi:hypothetical protein